MPQYTVHLYREMKLRFDNITAASAQEAADWVSELQSDRADNVADCDGETFGALVDVVGDEDYRHSRMIDFEAKRTRKVAHLLLEALKEVLPILEAHAITIRLMSGGHCHSEAYDK